MPLIRYDITRTSDPVKIRIFIENCRKADDQIGVRMGQDHLFRMLAELGAREFAPELFRDPLVVRFMQMLVCVEELRGTRASRTRNALKASDDKLRTIERLLRQWARKGSGPEHGTETFHFLKGVGRLDLTGEALLLEFKDRFEPIDAEAITEARERLANYNYLPAVELRRQYWERVSAERAGAILNAAASAEKRGLAFRDATVAPATSSI
jgi:hypothetical protein